MIDLQQFCGKEETRHYITKPFKFDDVYTYATNGHILVRVDGARPDAAPAEVITIASIDKILGPIMDAAFVRAPNLNIGRPLSKGCEYCHGLKLEEECEECDGAGKVSIKRTVLLHAIAFDADYVAQLLGLPDIEFAIAAEWEKPIFFRFMQGIGALQPLREKLYDRKSVIASWSPS